MNKKEFEAYAIEKYVRGNTFKFRKVADLIRGLEVNYALQLLKNMPHVTAIPLYKALFSVKSNYLNKNKDSNSTLMIDYIAINEAKKIKRFRSRARGRSSSIIKLTSHIMIGLNSKGETK